MLPWTDKGPIRGYKGSNFEVGLWARRVVISGLKLHENSISDGARSPKYFLGQIRAH